MKEIIRTLKPYIPEEPAEAVKERLGIDRLVRLSANENPYGTSPLVREAILSYVTHNDANYYPDGNATDLRMKLANYWQVQPEQLVIGVGLDEVIAMVNKTLITTGDSIVVSVPAFSEYALNGLVEGAEVREVPADFETGQYDFSALVKAVDETTRVVWICNPNNPAGKIYSRKELEKLYSMCRPRGIYILVDEAYSDFVIEDRFTSMVNVVPDKDGIIVVNSLSKNLGISGWRIGYVISTPEVIYNVLKLNQHLITCPATLLSMYVSHYFKDIVDITLPQVIEVVEKRKKVTKYMNEIGLEYLEGTATFYIFMNIGNYKYSSMELGLYLLMKYGISIVPGLAYGQSTERFIRIGVGAETVDDIKMCLDIIKRVIDNNEYDDDFIESELKNIHMNRFVPLN